jgi:hypothetical protein
MQLKEDALELD